MKEHKVINKYFYNYDAKRMTKFINLIPNKTERKLLDYYIYLYCTNKCELKKVNYDYIKNYIIESKSLNNDYVRKLNNSLIKKQLIKRRIKIDIKNGLICNTIVEIELTQLAISRIDLKDVITHKGVLVNVIS